MGAAKKLVKNFILLGSANFVEQALFIVIYIWIARASDLQQYGYFFTALVFSRIAFKISEFGINTVVTRDIARQRGIASAYMGEIFTLRGALCALTFILIQPILLVAGYAPSAKISVEILSVYMIIWSFSQSIGAAFRGLERQDIVALIVVSGIIPTFMLLAVVLTSGSSIHVIEAVFVGGAGIQLLAGYALMARFVGRAKLSFDLIRWKRIMMDSLPLGLAGMFALIYFRVDTLILSLYFPEGQIVGLYNSAYNIFVALTFLPFIFYHIALPLFSRLAQSSLSRLRSYYRHSLFGVGAGALAVAAAAFLFAGPIIRIVYGEKYLVASDVLKVLSGAGFFASLSMVAMAMLTALNLLKALLKATLIAVILNIGLNFLLIPRLDMTGAAINTVVTEASFFLMCVLAIGRHSRRIPADISPAELESPLA